jgi:hypothetical protein
MMAGALRAFARFWIGFVVGDDWVIAAAVALGLGLTWGLVRAGEPAWWLLPGVVIGVVVLSVRRAIERGG